MTTPADQTRPYRGHPPHARGSDTSAEAADSMRVRAMRLSERAVWWFDMSRNQGMTDHELAERLGTSLQTAVPRRRELVIAGLVRDSGRRRKTPSGRRATVWVRTGDGEQMELL